jgi:hypothetical protein
MPRLLALFQSTRAVIRADKLCKQNEIKGKIIPVPREISSECGMAIELDISSKEQVKAILEKEGIVVGFYFQEL